MGLCNDYRTCDERLVKAVEAEERLTEKEKAIAALEAEIELEKERVLFRDKELKAKDELIKEWERVAKANGRALLMRFGIDPDKFTLEEKDAPTEAPKHPCPKCGKEMTYYEDGFYYHCYACKTTGLDEAPKSHIIGQVLSPEDIVYPSISNTASPEAPKPMDKPYEYVCYDCGKVEKSDVPMGGNMICDECYAKDPETYSPPEAPKPSDNFHDANGVAYFKGDICNNYGPHCMGMPCVNCDKFEKLRSTAEKLKKVE
jgi:hypothetical protein